MLEYYPYPFWTGVFALGLFVYKLRKKLNHSRLFFIFVFGLYVLFVAGITLFPIPLFALRGLSPHLTLSKINLVPFEFGNLFESRLSSIVAQLLGNILLTIPFGFGLNFIIRIRPVLVLPLALASGLVIEATQFFLSIFFLISYRSVDINDVILNFLGSLLGFILFYLFAFSYVFLVRRMGIKPKGFFDYLLQVACCGLGSKKAPCGTANVED